MSKRSDDYTKQINDLVAVFRSATDGTEWVVLVEPKVMRDEDEHNIKVPTLALQKGPTRLYLDPTGYDIPGAEGVADLYLMPSGEPMASLYREADGWKIHSPFPSEAMVMAKPKEWGRANADDKSIRTVLEAIVNNVASKI